MTRFFCFAALGAALTSCLGSTKDTCSVTTVEPIVVASGPKTVAVNQKATFTVSYQPQSTCGQLAGIYEASTTVPNTYVVGVRVAYTDCNCPASTVLAQTAYSFTPTTAGTYYLNFLASNASGFVTDTLVAH